MTITQKQITEKLRLHALWLKGNAQGVRANLWGADLSVAYLSGADLIYTNLSGVHGINDYVKCIQIDTYPITYTAEIIQIGCQRHTHQEWADFSDAQIRAMDGVKALTWWRKYKGWLFQTIEMCPAEPTQKKGRVK